MKFDRSKFFNGVRKLSKKLSQRQVDGFNFILSAWENETDLTDIRHLAYMLATTWHETAKIMQPIEEWGKGRGRRYGKADPVTGKIYFGRGYVQLTWDYNYKRMGKILGIPLYENPDLALDPQIAAKIMFEGMLTRKTFKGDFTGKALENYFNKTKEDPYNARRIINGMDSATKVAGYYWKFKSALEESCLV